MARTLDVYLQRDLVGHLTQGEGGEMTFVYTQDWLASPHAMPLSNSLPLRAERFRRRECRAFFAGILPEETKRDLVAKNLGISSRNDFRMLELIGGECAGAVTFMPSGETLPEEHHHYRALDEESLAKILEQLHRRPLMAGEDGVRLSLAGAQDKLAVHVRDGKLSLPLGNAPSTHILKPAPAYFEGVVFNEAFCMKLAQACGLEAAPVEIRSVQGIDYLLVERYDRRGSDRLHQEDFCQALGIVSEMKYQSEGGPSLKDCFVLLRQASSAPALDLRKLLDAAIFNYLVGNNDAHGKNFSLLYDITESPRVRTRMAPLYDIVCTACYPELSSAMAMKIGGENKPERVTPRHFEKLAEDAGLSKPLVRQRVPELASIVLANLTNVEIDRPVVESIAALIEARCLSVISSDNA